MLVTATTDVVQETRRWNTRKCLMFTLLQ